MTIYKTKIFNTIESILLNQEGAKFYYNPEPEKKRDGTFFSVDGLTIDSRIKDYIRNKWKGNLYRHQYEAIKLINKGENVTITTPTSSGKSLIFSVSVFEKLLKNNDSTALLLYPQKALANDQLSTLREYWDELLPDEKYHKFKVARYDGGVPNELRKDIRANGQIILSNPDMVHLSLLQWHDHWENFFKNLKVIVIDEAHEYSGVFGGNVGYIMRRLRQICDKYGSTPQFVITSATIRNPDEFINSLINTDSKIIDKEYDTSLQGEKKYWIFGSDKIKPIELIAKIAKELAEKSLTSLIFCPSRKMAENLVTKFRKGLDEGWAAVYRAGLLSEERERIEKGLKLGSIKCVFSTNALELGIDIGEIDLVICIGIPSTMMSLTQKIGRAARSGKPGGIILIPLETPIDAYYSDNPDNLFNRSYEELNISLNNKKLALQHSACILDENGKDEKNINLDLFNGIINKLLSEHLRGAEYHSEIDVTNPHLLMNIRGGFQGRYDIINISGKNKEPLGEIDEFHMLREAYPQAIYKHGGKSYLVNKVQQKGNKAVFVTPHYNGHHTSPIINTEVKVGDLFVRYKYNELTTTNSVMIITERIVAVHEKKPNGEQIKSKFRQGMVSPLLFYTHGNQFKISASLWNKIKKQLNKKNAEDIFHNTARLLYNLFPTVDPNVDIQDINYTIKNNDDGGYSLYLYDEIDNGLDITTFIIDKWDILIDNAINRIRNCDCTHHIGCFKCIMNPDVELESDKNASILMLNFLLESLSSEPNIFDHENQIDEHIITKIFHCDCGEQVGPNDKFCKNCGMNLIEANKIER